MNLLAGITEVPGEKLRKHKEFAELKYRIFLSALIAAQIKLMKSTGIIVPGW
jgi:hypothetical protein